VNTFILRNTQATLSVVFSAGYADSTVTATITRADGTVVTTGPATKDLAVAGRYTYVLLPQTAVNALTVKWEGSFGGIVQSLDFPVEIVGAHLFTVAEARAFGDQALKDSAKYPDSVIIDARERITDYFKRVCSVSFTPRYGRVTLDGFRVLHSLWLPDTKVARVFTITENGVAVDPASVDVYPTGQLFRRVPWAADYQNITVDYQHGWEAPPDDVSRAALMLARYDLTTNQLADRFISFANELGVIRQAVPGERYPTGIPIVDAVLARYSHSAPLMPLTV
jgi:hypothetical protein